MVFDPIDDFSKMAKIAEQPMSKAQNISMAFVIFQTAGKFKSDLKAWNRKLDVHKTWPNMKSYFCEAYQEIRDVEDTPVTETFDQANMINEVLEGVQEIVRTQVFEALPHVPPAFQQMQPPVYTPQANMIEYPQEYPEQQPP